jgi:hypothetical protein
VLHPPHQQNLQAVLLDPLERGRVPPDILDQRALAWIHGALQSFRSLPPDGDVFADVQKDAGFEEGLRCCERPGKGSGCQSQFDDNGLQEGESVDGVVLGVGVRQKSGVNPCIRI